VKLAGAADADFEVVNRWSAGLERTLPLQSRDGLRLCLRWETLLKGNGEDLKTVQESFRHAGSKMTLDTYTQGLMPVKRAAQRKVIEMIVPIGSQASRMTTVSA
jgi:hypothetical protein